MYFCQNLEPADNFAARVRVVTWRVTRDADDHLVWVRHRHGRWISGAWIAATWNAARVVARRVCLRRLPWWTSVASGSHVTGRQAETLTGIRAPAALDYLAETDLAAPGVANYQKPRAAKAKPTPLAVARRELVKAGRKIIHYELRAARVAGHLESWRRRVARLERRITKLEQAESAKGEADG